MVTRPDEPIPDDVDVPGPDVDEGEEVVPPFEADTEKLRVSVENEPAGEDEPPPGKRDD